MEADTIIAACATVTAVAALAVSVREGRAARAHNRQSVRPILQIRKNYVPGTRAGLLVRNVGLGPAMVTKTELWLDGVPVDGGTDRAGVNAVRDALQGRRPMAVSFGAGMVLATDYAEYLLSVPDFDAASHAEFEELIRARLRIRITYDSLYGGESFVAGRGPDAP